MKQIDKADIRAIYALGSVLNIVESGNKNDNLHVLVHSLTGKDSVSTLSAAEGYKVLSELRDQMKMKNRQEPLEQRRPKANTAAPGKMDKAQQGLAWRLIYRLEELDTRSSEVTVGERMVGAIRKILQMDANIANPFVWVTVEQGTKLIEQLKRYVRSAESKQSKRAV